MANYIGQTDAEVMDIVRKLEPSIPLPEMIHTWSDEEYSYMVVKRVEGIPLRAAWSSMSSEERERLASDVTASVHALVQHTSALEERANRGAIFVDRSERPERRNSEKAKAYYLPIANSGAPFHLFHDDLSPLNILVENGRLAAIIDWELLSYQPRWYMATTTEVMPRYWFEPPLYDSDEDAAWVMLCRAVWLKIMTFQFMQGNSLTGGSKWPRKPDVLMQRQTEKN